MIQDTSQRAFKQDVLPTIGERQLQVLKAIENLGNATNSEISEYLGWSINRITPRTNELVKMGKVVDAGKRACYITGRLAYIWVVKPEQNKLL